MCAGSVIPVTTSVPQTLQLQTIIVKATPYPTGEHPIVWRDIFPEDMSASLVSWENPTGKVTNSDIELAGRLIFHACMADCYDLR